MERFDVIVIGGGQSGLAAGYYLRRTGLSYVILDNQNEGGGAWLHTWKSLQLFSPAQWSSLPGMIMPGGSDRYQNRDVAIDYLRQYETKYNLSVRRPVQVKNVRKNGEAFDLETTNGTFQARTVISATGTFSQPYIPHIKGKDNFKGTVIHSGAYRSPDAFIGKRVAIIGEGNSGAQILAEVSKVATTLWVTRKAPEFLPDHIDGRYLFDAATQMYEAQKAGKSFTPLSLGHIVMVDAVKDARGRKVLDAVRPFDHFTEDALVWEDGRTEKVHAVIFCTGFNPSLNHLAPLNVVNASGKVDTHGTRSKAVPGLWLIGYGNWTGFASATLIGVGRSAKKTAEEILEYLAKEKPVAP